MRPFAIDPGALRHHVTIEEAVAADDGSGGTVETWAAIGSTFAAVEPVSAESRFGADRFAETATHRVTLRFRAGLRSGMRFVRGARRLSILTVQDPDETGRYLICRTREEVP